MDVLDLVRYETKRAYAWLENLVADIPAEQASWKPPGTANSIAATYAHIVVNADIDVTRIFHQQEPLITGEWASRLGDRTYTPSEWEATPDIDWDAEFDWETLREYGRAVHGQMLRQVGALSADDLDRQFDMVGTKTTVWKGIDVIDLHGWNHVEMHGGEIACLKGLQGGEGYRPFNVGYDR
jgi:hypothetical protein